MDSVGRQQDSYQLAARMLLSAHPGAIETLRSRFTTEFLPNLATSRSNEACQHSSRISLPGIGSDYWKHTRAHLFCGYMPPSFPKSLIQPARQWSEHLIQQYLETACLLWDSRDPQTISTVQWSDAEILLEPNTVPLLHIPVQPRSTGKYQNGSVIKEENITTFHGTRETNIRSILSSGIHPSPRSHGQIGIWANYSLREALNWTPTVVDLSPSLAIAITGDIRSSHQNSGIASGNYNRMIFRSLTAQRLPPVFISSIITGIPSALRMDWYNGLASAIKHSIRILSLLPCNQAFVHDECLISTIAGRTHLLTSQRLAYGGQCLSDGTIGMHNGFEYLVVVQLSALLAELFWTLQLDSVIHRRDRLWNFVITDLPIPLQRFLATFFPTLPQFLCPFRRGPDVTWFSLRWCKFRRLATR